MRLVAIEADDHERPILCRTEDFARFYWGIEGPSWVKPDSYRVLKDYGEMPDDSDKPRLRQLEVRFVGDFPPTPDLRDDEGWLSPGGDFYPCPHGSHTTEAWALYVMTFEQVSDTPRDQLLQEGWLEIHRDMVVRGEKLVDVTWAQVAMLQVLGGIKRDNVERAGIEKAIRQIRDEG